MSKSIADAIAAVGVVHDPTTGKDVYAYEIDGYGSQNLME